MARHFATAAQSVMIVRRGLSAAYYHVLLRMTADAGVTLTVDRRIGDRRGTHGEDARAPDRRHENRRGKPPASWFEQGFAMTTAANKPLLTPRKRSTRRR